MAQAPAEPLNQNRTNDRDALFVQLHEVFVQRGYDGATLANLARACGLSKASLYHHFPGGKPEMASSLVRFSIAELHKMAFSHLQSSADPARRVQRFIEGFSAYTRAGKRNCLLAVINHHGSGADDLGPLQADIASQFKDWHSLLASTLQQMGMKPKKAQRRAHDLLAALYGALMNAKLHGQPSLFTLVMEQRRKQFAVNKR